MTHQQILDKLAAKHLVQSIDDDLARLTFKAMCYEKGDAKQLSYILPKLLNRWNCILKAGDEVSNIYKQKTVLALCILLHKYGFFDQEIAGQAVDSIDELNKEVVLSDDFFRKSDEIKQLLKSSPVPLKRKPSIPDSITFYRAKDLISIQLENRFYPAYIHEISGANESPIIEFYNEIFNSAPTLDQLKNLSAKGEVYNDGKERISRFSVYGLKHLPDLACQIRLISAGFETAPSNTHLEAAVGLYTVSDIFEIQSAINRLFKK